MRISTFSCVSLFIVFLLSGIAGFAQRNYGSGQQAGASGVLCVACQVTNPANAADGNPRTYSTLNVTLGLAARTYQQIGFSQTLPAGTPVHLKLGTGDGLASLTALGAVTVQAYNGNTPVGSEIVASSLLTALSNNDQFELIFSPAGTYNAVRVTLNGGLAGALANLYFYEAWYNGSGAVDCGTPIDELHGISSALLGLGLGVGGVQNPQLAIDGDLTTFATLNAGVAVAGAAAEETAIWQTPSAIGDSVRLTLAIPQTLLEANVLSSITVTTYNGNTSNNDTRAFNSALLSVRLLALNGTKRIVTVTFAPEATFDRVRLTLGGGIAGVLSSLDFYEAQRFTPAPTLSLNGSAVSGTINICNGSTATLIAASPAGNTFYWYTTATGGTPIFTGASFTTPPVTASATYYVAVVRNGCTDGSLRAPITVAPVALPASPTFAAAAATICSGTTATFAADAITGVQVRWYTAPTGGAPVFSGNTFTTPALTATTTYYAEALNASGCASAIRTPVTATVQPLPPTPTVTASAASVNQEQSVTFTVTNADASVTYNWYVAASGGTPVYTGTSYTTDALAPGTRNYYVEAVGAAGCVSNARGTVTVNVNARPDVTVTPPTQSVNAGQTATITASSSTPNATFNWYTTPTGGTPIFSGVSFTTPPVSSTSTYYAEATDPVSGAISNRAAAVVAVNAAPSITVNPPSQAVNAGQTATFTASSTTAGAMFNWYTTPTGGTPVFTGPTFTTPRVSANTTYYAEAVDPATGATSPRASGTVTVNAVPSIAVTPPSQAVNAGQTATFTASSDRPGATFNWYPTPSGGTPVYTGATFTTPALSSNATYYAEAVDPATGATSARATATVTVNAAPSIAVNPPSQSVNAGQTATFTASSNTPGATFNWYSSPTGGTPVYSGTTFTTPPISSNTTYYAAAVDPSTGATSARATANVLINATPSITVTPPSRSVNAGQTASFAASSNTPNATFNWYTTATGGTPIFTGANFTTPPVSSNTTYYAEAVNPATGATSTRATANVLVNAAPSIAVNPPSQSVNAGQTATFTASSGTPGAIFNWYTDPTGGTSVFTGATFTTPAIKANTTYYAEAVDPSTGATSPRASGTVLVNTAPNVAVTPPSRSVDAGQTASFTASSSTPGAVFNWYSDPDGVTPIYSGPNFTTPAITSSTTFYVEAVNPSTGAVSTRATASVLVNATPSLTITPPTRSVNAGQTATFTASSTTPNTTFNWYTDAAGGTPIYSGATFTTPPASGNTVYYAEAVDPATGATSDRKSATILVNAAPDVTVTPPVRSVNARETATFTASSSTTGARFNWYTDPTGGMPIFSGATFTTPPVTAQMTYYAEAVDPATGAVSSRATATVNVNNAPSIAVTPPSQNVKAGQTATFNASSTTANATFNWYTNPEGGTPIYTGSTFVTPPVTSPTTYYAEAVDPATGATSPRTSATVGVNEAPTVAVTPPSRAVNAGQTATFTASSSTGGATFNWYTDAAGGAPIYSGPTFTTPPITSNTTFYAEAVNPATGATSARATATVVVNGTPSIVITPPSQTVNAGRTATFTASSGTTGTTFNWYTTPEGGTPIFTGSTFVTPPVNSDATYYAEAVDPSTGATSERSSATVLVNGSPTITVNPPSRAVNAGQTASFTATSGTPGATFNWYTTPTGGTPVFTGANFITPPITSTTTYYAEAADPANGARSQRATATVTVNNAPDVAVNPPSQSVNAGSSASFTATSTTPGVTFNWYRTPTGGNPIFTGPSFSTPVINANTVFYAEAVNPATGARSTRAAATVLVNSAPDIMVTPMLRTVNAGQTASFKASSTTPGAIFTWYGTDTPDAVAIATGADFTTPPVSAPGVFYAEARDPKTGATSPRIPVTVAINPTVTIAVIPPTRLIPVNTSTTFTASSPYPGAVYHWYTQPTGGASIFTGAVFTTPVLSVNTVYYAEAEVPSAGLRSGRVPATATIDVNTLPVFVPNAFSPNGDGNNDVLTVLGPPITDYRMRIYNQWGQLIFVSTDSSKGWDGTWKGVIQPVGVYVYYLEGSAGAGAKIDRKGTITLVR